MFTLGAITVVIFGLLVGSFLGVCIYRIPIGKGWEDDSFFTENGLALPKTRAAPPGIEKIGIATPARSFCPNCNAQLRWFHNLPLLSWLWLRGRCAFCKARIPVRYPSVEALSALCAFLSYYAHGFTLTALIVYCTCAALIVVSFIDYDYYIIPDTITYTGTALGLLLAVLNEYTAWLNPPLASGIVDSLLGILLGAGFLWLIAFLYRVFRKIDALGLGDVKLLALIGSLYGAAGAFVTILLGSLLGSVLGIALLLVCGRKFSHRLPFGPYLALGAILFLFVDSQMLEAFRASLQMLLSPDPRGY